MKVYKIWHFDHDNGYLEKDIPSVKEFLDSELQDLEPGNSVLIKYQCIEMTEEEYDALPDFTGF